MITSNFKRVTFSGDLPTLCVEFENIIKHFRALLLEEEGIDEEKANELIAEIGRRAFMDDEERQKLIDEAVKDFNFEVLFKEEE